MGNEGKRKGYNKKLKLKWKYEEEKMDIISGCLL